MGYNGGFKVFNCVFMLEILMYFAINQNIIIFEL